jgi:hypothetical protein
MKMKRLFRYLLAATLWQLALLLILYSLEQDMVNPDFESISTIWAATVPLWYGFFLLVYSRHPDPNRLLDDETFVNLLFKKHLLIFCGAFIALIPILLLPAGLRLIITSGLILVVLGWIGVFHKELLQILDYLIVGFLWKKEDLPEGHPLGVAKEEKATRDAFRLALSGAKSDEVTDAYEQLDKGVPVKQITQELISKQKARKRD